MLHLLHKMIPTSDFKSVKDKKMQKLFTEGADYVSVANLEQIIKYIKEANI